MKFTTKLAVLICAMMLFCNPVFAAELSAVMNAYTTDENITLFLRNQGEELSQVYIGSEECEDYSVEDLGPIRTTVIVDNSLSIQAKYRNDIKSFLADLVAARNDGDLFTIATFAEDITYLVEDSNDYLDIKNKIDSFEFANQETFFSKTLYTVIQDIEKNEDIRYSRVIIVADGADYEAYGYTDEELHRKIESARIPIYTIGCATAAGDNSEQLKEMFSLSRMTNAQSYLIDETPLSEILQSISNDVDIEKLILVPQDSLCDGSVKTIRLEYGDHFSVVNVNMPFKATPVEEPSSSVVESSSSAPVEIDTKPTIPEPKPLPEEEPTVPVVLIIALVVLAVVIIVAGVVLSRKKKKSVAGKEKVDLSGLGHSKDTAVIRPKSSTGTEILGTGSSKTGIISGGQSIRIRLQDIQNPSKTFEYPIRERVLIGKDRTKCQIVIDYNKYVSSVHCEVFQKGKDFYVRDGGGDVVSSTNGTFVNDERVIREHPLPADSILKLGEVSFRVTFS